MTIASDRLSRYTEVWIPDSEYQTSASGPRRPVCLCARELYSRRRIELFFDQPQENPFPDRDDVLMVGYNAAAEYATMLALGWQPPQLADTLDLLFEYLNEVNGVWRNNMALRRACGLVDALAEYGLDALSHEEKDEERDYIIRHGITQPPGVAIEQHRERILRYCWTDVDGTEKLLLAMLEHIDLDQAVHRGGFSIPVAWFEHNGLPASHDLYQQIATHRESLRLEIAQSVEAEHRYGVYVVEGKNKRPVFKQANFDALINRLGIQHWPVTSTGHYSTSDKEAFKPMARLHPQLEPLRQARKSIDNLSRFRVAVHADNRNRFSVFPFGGVTGRNQPKASECILLRPKWLRSLIQPRPGMALIVIDIVAAEAALAAAFSGDAEALRVYISGVDQYLAFAITSGAAPADATPESHPDIRELYKGAVLSIQYGVGAATLSQNLGVPLWQAEQILRQHKRIYATYWAWAEAQVQRARLDGYISTAFGWRMAVDLKTAHNLILDYPQQAGCAEVLRLACLFAVEEGLGPYLCAPLHDALFLECPEDLADTVCATAQDCFIRAGHIVTADAITLRLDAEVIRHPDRYTNKKGAAIWALVQDFLARHSQALPQAA